MISRRRKLLLGLAASTMVPRALLGQTAKTLPRVAVLFNGSPETDKAFVKSFLNTMRELGYVDGRSFVLDVRHAEGRNDRLPEIIAEMLVRKPVAIVVSGSHAVWAAKKATTAVPIVMASVGDPVGQGLVASLARPGGNITGVAILTEAVALKRMELLRELFPKASRFGRLANPSNPFSRLVTKEMEAAAGRLGVELLTFNAASSGELDNALAAIADQRPPALLVGADGLFSTLRKKIVESLARSRIPAIYSTGDAVIDGGLMSYSHTLAETYPKSASYVHRILKGAKPADLPIEQPTRFELIVNLKTARAIGVKIPPSVLLRADRVIE